MVEAPVFGTAPVDETRRAIDGVLVARAKLRQLRYVAGLGDVCQEALVASDRLLGELRRIEKSLEERAA